MGNGLGPSEPTFENFAELITSEQVPAATTTVDRTNPILGQGDLPQEPAQIDKALRDVGNFPERPDTVTTRPVIGSDEVEAVGLDAQGNTLGRVFMGDPAEAQRIAQRANQGIQRVTGGNGGGGGGGSGGGGGTIPEEFIGAPEQNPDPVQREGSLEEFINRGVQRQQQSGARAQPQPEGTGETEAEQPEPEGTLERLAPQGATAQDVAELIDPTTESVTSFDPQIGDFVTRQRGGGVDIASALEGSELQPTPSEQQLQQAQAQAPEDFGRLSDRQQLAGQVQGAVEQVGQQLQEPQVRRGLAQLAQLFVRPDSNIGQVARRQEQAATQRLQAEQVQALVEGEDVEAASPEVVRQAEEIQQAEERTEQQERRLDLRESELQLQRQQQLVELAQATRERQEGEELKGFEIDAINQQAIGEFLPRVLDQVDQSKGLQIISQLQAAENPSPEIIRSQLPEEQQEQFDQFRNRLQEAVLSGDQGALFGVVQGKGEETGGGEEQTQTGAEQQTETGEGGQTTFTIQSGSPRELANAKQNATPGDTIEVNQEIQVGNKTLPPGLYQVQDDAQRSLDPIAQ